ncbi:hypothetical protein BH18ACT8_BH18ACT8_03570 [soil metagenome]
MIDLFSVQNGIMLALTFALFVCKAVAFVDAVMRPENAFVAGGKQTKPFWLLVLGLAVVANTLIWSPLSFLNLIGTVAALVYLADVRPILKTLTRR